MESCHYLANVTQTKSALQTISPMKGNPQSMSLVLKCTLYLKDFQNKGRVTLKKWVELEQAHYQKQVIPKLLHNLYCLCKMVATYWQKPTDVGDDHKLERTY